MESAAGIAASRLLATSQSVGSWCNEAIDEGACATGDDHATGSDDAQRKSIGIAIGDSDVTAGRVVSSRDRGASCKGAASALPGTDWQGRAWQAVARGASSCSCFAGGPGWRWASGPHHRLRSDGTGRRGSTGDLHAAADLDKSRSRKLAGSTGGKRRPQHVAITTGTAGSIHRIAPRAAARCMRVVQRDPIHSATVS